MEERDYPIEFDTLEDEVAFKQQVEAWYEEYGDVYTTEFNDVIFVFRGLSIDDLNRANRLYVDELEKMEYICRLAVLAPEIEDYSLEIYAGIPEVLSVVILEESGFSNDPTKVNELIFASERELENPINRIPCIIHEAFPDKSLEEIESWPIERLVKYYTRAKWILENLRGIILSSEEDENQRELERAISQQR